MSTQEEQVLHQDSLFKIYCIEKDIFIDTFQKVSFNSIDGILKQNVIIQVTNMMDLQRACIEAPKNNVRFGIKTEPILIEIDSRGLQVHARLFYSPEDLESRRSEIIKEILIKLNSQGIVFGIDYDKLNALVVNEPILLASGIPPIDGEDASLNIPDYSEPTPVIKEDKADFYNITAIHSVKKGDWLGERINPKPGVPGKNVFGKEIAAKAGQQARLYYDAETIEEVNVDQKTELRAKINGAINFKKDKKTLNVFNCIEMETVDYGTGNIEFDGHVVVHNTIVDGFSVYGAMGVEVRGVMGVGRVTIKSDGDIAIVGGISGNGEATIVAQGSIFTKFVNNAILVAKQKVEIGYYAIDSQITAESVTVSSDYKGTIIGGNIVANSFIRCNKVGNQVEKMSYLTVKGFDRDDLIKNQDNLKKKHEEKKVQANMLLQKLSILKATSRTNPNLVEEVNKLSQAIMYISDEIYGIENEMNRIKEVMKVRGEGEVRIKNTIFPNNIISIKNDIYKVKDKKPGLLLYYDSGIKLSE